MTEPYYQDDLVTLYHGDCLVERFWLAADVLVTDPPYGIRVRQRTGGTSFREHKHSRTQTTNRDPVKGDRSVGLRDRALALWGPKPAMVFGSWKAPRPSAVRHRLVWHKAGSYSGPSREAFLGQDEEIYVLGQGFFRRGVPMRSVITTSEARHHEVRRNGHPTSKPVPLMVALLEKCPDGAVVADPFAGSGATLVAARQLGLHAVGIEIEEKYCWAAANRLARLPVS